MCVWIRPTLEPTAVAIVVVESSQGTRERGGVERVVKIVGFQISKKFKRCPCCTKVKWSYGEPISNPVARRRFTFSSQNHREGDTESQIQRDDF